MAAALGILGGAAGTIGGLMPPSPLKLTLTGVAVGASAAQLGIQQNSNAVNDLINNLTRDWESLPGGGTGGGAGGDKGGGAGGPDGGWGAPGGPGDGGRDSGTNGTTHGREVQALEQTPHQRQPAMTGQIVGQLLDDEINLIGHKQFLHPLGDMQMGSQVVDLHREIPLAGGWGHGFRMGAA